MLELSSWVLGLSSSFILYLFVVLIVIAVLIVLDNGNAPRKVEMAVLAGDERDCEEMAARVKSADRLELVATCRDALEQILRRNMVLVLIVEQQVSGFTEQLIMHLQRASEKLEETVDLSELRYAIFGIGDTAGEEFNALALSIDLDLRKLGARSETPMHLFDIATSEFGIDDEFESFINRISPNSFVRTQCSSEETATVQPSSFGKELPEGLRIRANPQRDEEHLKESPVNSDDTESRTDYVEIAETLNDPKIVSLPETDDSGKDDDWELMDIADESHS